MNILSSARDWYQGVTEQDRLKNDIHLKLSACEKKITQLLDEIKTIDVSLKNCTREQRHVLQNRKFLLKKQLLAQQTIHTRLTTTLHNLENASHIRDTAEIIKRSNAECRGNIVENDCDVESIVEESNYQNDVLMKQMQSFIMPSHQTDRMRSFDDKEAVLNNVEDAVNTLTQQYPVLKRFEVPSNKNDNVESTRVVMNIEPEKKKPEKKELVYMYRG